MKSHIVEPYLLELYRKLRALVVATGGVRVEPPAPAVHEMWQSGIPLLFCHPPQLEEDGFFKMMGAVGGILKDYHPERSVDMDRILAALPSDGEQKDQIVSGILRRDGEWLNRMVEEHGLSEELIGLMLSLTLRPFLRYFSEQLRGHLHLELWPKSYCPICGGYANFSRLSRAIGKRYLYCSLCETEWLFTHISCPFCVHPDPAQVRYFTVDEDERYRVYVCEKCKGYIKTIDESKIQHDEKVELFWEDVKTVYLDLLAMREGYENKITEIPSYGEEVKN
jgi:FdhE protein